MIGHVTIGFVIYGFLLLANFNQPTFSHSFSDIKLQRYWGHDLDLFGSCDIIGHVTIGLAMCGFLLVVEILSFKGIGVTTLTFQVK